MAEGIPRFSLGGTGGSDRPASDRDELRLGLWLVDLLPSTEVNLSSDVGVSPEVKSSSTEKQMDSWESLLDGDGAESGAGQKWMGAVRRRLKTVLGLGTGFAAGLPASELVSMARRFGAELFLKASKFPGPGG